MSLCLFVLLIIIGNAWTDLPQILIGELKRPTHSIPVVNLNSNRTCPVCTCLPDNSVYWPDPMVQYVALTRLTYDRGQFSWHSPVRGLTMTTPLACSDFLQYPALSWAYFTDPTGLVHRAQECSLIWFWDSK